MIQLLVPVKIASLVSDGSAAAERDGGEREAREDASSKARPVGREGRIDQTLIRKNLAMLSGSCRQRLVIVVATTVSSLVSVNIL